MGNFLDAVSGLLVQLDGDDDHDRSPLPYREQREFARREDRVKKAGDVHLRKVYTVSEAEHFELSEIAVNCDAADQIARRGPIHAAAVARSIGRYDAELEAMSHDLIIELRRI